MLSRVRKYPPDVTFRLDFRSLSGANPIGGAGRDIGTNLREISQAEFARLVLGRPCGENLSANIFRGVVSVTPGHYCGDDVQNPRINPKFPRRK